MKSRICVFFLRFAAQVSRRRPTYRLIDLLTMFSWSLGVLGTVGPTAAQTTNYPAADYQMWRDDEIFVPLLVSGQLKATSYEYNPSDKTLSSPLGYCGSTAASGSQMAAAAGRIMSPYSDQVVIAYPGASGNVEVRFADKCNLAKSSVETGPSAILGVSSGMPALVAPPHTGLPWFYDIATGDLDKYPDADSNYRDEVVVAYLTQSPSSGDLLQPIVAVLDYSANASVPTVTWMMVADGVYKWGWSSGGDVPVIPLSVVTGDFDGDIRKEIAVAYVRGKDSVGIAVFRYTTTEIDGVVERSLNPVTPLVLGMDKPTDYTPDYQQGTMDAAAGDFDGDGKDELAVAAIEYGYKDEGVLKRNTPRIAVDLKTFKADDALTMTQVSTAIPYEDSSSTGDDFVAGVQLAAGLFKYAPSADPTVESFDINRRQLALATNGSSGAVDLRTLVYNTNLKPTLATADAYYVFPGSGRLSFRMAAGGFNGLQTTDSSASVVSSLAFTTWANNGQVLYLFDPEPTTGKLGAPHFTKTLSTTANPSKSTSVAPLVAYDYGNLPTGAQTPGVLYGDAQYLGAPLYFTIEGVSMTDYILQEPPKHVYWKVGNYPLVPNCFDRMVCNISAQDAFTLGTIQTETVGMTSDYHDTFDYSLGVSETGSGEFTYGSIGLLPPVASLSLSETLGYDYADHAEDYNKNMTKRSVTLKHYATRDDAINYRIQDINVWRYPVFGIATQDPDGNEMPNSFLDITAPTTRVNTALRGGIDCMDWYQPVHENGNILSYPEPVHGENGDSNDPADMGSFQVPCTDDSGKTCDHDAEGHALSSMTVTDKLLDAPTMFTWSGTEPTVTLIDTRSETQGKTHTWSHTLKNSEEIKATGRVPLSVNPAGLKVKVGVDFAFNGKWSWGGAHTMEMNSDDVSTIQLSVPPGTPSEAYNVYPAFYITDSGTTKVSFAVDTNAPDGQWFWEAEYYGQPDPALNLPLRFNPSVVANTTVWTPNTLDSRKLMRGFFVRHAEAEPKTGDFPEYYDWPTAGEQVRLEARVYNYSLGQTVNPEGGMKVRFDCVPIDPDTHAVEEDKRTEIGTTTIGPLGPRGMTTAVINWDTSQINLEGRLEHEYRIYVVLDPDNAVPNEKYETESPASRTYTLVNPSTGLPIADCSDPNRVPFPAECIDPGQNNEGYRVVKLLAIEADDPRIGKPADVHLHKDALAARDPSDPSVWLTDTVQAEEGQLLELRVRVDSDVLARDSAHLLLFDGDPEKKGTLIADKKAFTGNPDGSYVWVEWTPTEPGPHRLFAQVVESLADTHPGNAIDDLMVVVHKAK